jgi:hypothetical protein
MPRLQKILVPAVALTAGVVLTTALWPRPRGHTYQGKTVEEWFGEYVNGRQLRIHPNAVYFRAEKAFQEIGTNAAPFLVSHYLSLMRPSPFERIVSPFTLTVMATRIDEQIAVRNLLVTLTPPRAMIIALLGTNDPHVVDLTETSTLP